MPELTTPPDKNCFQCYGIWLYHKKSPAIKSLKKISSHSAHGDRLWDSSHLLMDYFSTHSLKNKSRILDVGCGWGPASVYLASRGHYVTGLDIDEDVFAFLQLQADINNVTVNTQQGNMDAMKTSNLSEFDIIVGCDICFWDELTDEWFAMIKRAAKAGVKKIVITDPGREPFFNLQERCEKRWDTKLLEWYSLEPKKFTGYVLVVNLKN